METFWTNLANLLKVKTLVTLTVMAVFVYLAVTGAIGASQVMLTVTTVVAFYFGTQNRTGK